MLTKKLKSLILSTTAKSTYITSSADVTLALLAAATTAIIARNLSPSEFGTFITLWTYLTLIASLLDIGIGGGIIAFISKTKNPQTQNQYIGSILTFLTLIGIILLSVTTLIIKPLQTLLFPNIPPHLIIIISIGSIILLLASYLNDILRAKQQFIKSAISVSLFALCRLTLIIWLLLYNKFELSNIITIIALSPAVFLTFTYIFTNLPITSIRWHWTSIKQVLSFSGWLGVNQIITTLNSRIDILLLNRLSGAASAGIYGTASLMTRVFLIITKSLLSVFAPRLVQLKTKHQQKQFLLKITTLIFILWAGLAAVALVSKPLIVLIFGNQYLPALKPFYLLLVAMGGLLASIPLILPIIYILKKPKIIAYLSGFQLIIILIGNLIFIPKLGIISPALLLVITQFIILLLGGWYARKWWLSYK